MFLFTKHGDDGVRVDIQLGQENISIQFSPGLPRPEHAKLHPNMRNADSTLHILPILRQAGLQGTTPVT